MDISQAIHSLVPNAEFIVESNSFDKIKWLSPEITQPTEAEIQAEITRLQAEYDAKAYARSRATEYPAIGDQLDALWKGGAAAEDMLAAVMAVKSKYPKPE